MIKEENKHIFGLLGKNISYSFSKGFFSDKFKKLALNNHEYVNFDIDDVSDFSIIIRNFKSTLKGLNVTIPYKETILPFLDEVDDVAKEIGAVNTIKVSEKGTLKGYNTDVIGFKKSLLKLLKKYHEKALILGTGGASKAVSFVFKELKIPYMFVSRKPQNIYTLSYTDLSKDQIKNHQIIINCTPLGTHPNTENYPNIPYQYLTKKHLLYDLIYNPLETKFLSKGKQKGATIKNGLEMLKFQAEASWNIWNGK